MKTFYALLDLARLVGEKFAGTATGGSTTQLVDTNLKSTADGFFNNGTLFIASGTNNLETTIPVTAYTNSSRTFTFAALGSAINAGQRYEVTRLQYQRADLLEAVNQALQEIGTVTQKNDTLMSIASTEEYTLPTGVVNVVRVEVAANSSAPYGWAANSRWIERGGSLIFDTGKSPSTASRMIRLWYNATPAPVLNDSDVISDYVPRERLAWTAAYYATLGRTLQVGKDDPNLKNMAALFAARLQEMAVRYPIRNMVRATRGSGI